MKIIPLLVTLLSFSSWARADSYYESRNGKQYLCQEVTSGDPLPSCSSTCQYYDNFHSQCQYQTRCDYSSGCLIETTCEKWDSHNGKCQSEMSKYTCKGSTAPLTCTASCQYFDNFHGKCLYKTQCNLVNGDRCLEQKTCTQFDSFNNLCKAESTTTSCQ